MTRPSGVLAAAALATLVGSLCVRATKMHFAILTLAFAQMVHALFVSGLIFRPFGGVGKGLVLLGGGGLYIPRLMMAGVEVAPEVFHRVFYALIVVLFSGCVILLWRIVHSPFGQALKAIRENETRVVCIGLRVWGYRWSAFTMTLWTSRRGRSACAAGPRSILTVGGNEMCHLAGLGDILRFQ